MDSIEYFLRAEKANRRFRMTTVGLLLFAILVLTAAGSAVFILNTANHNNSKTQLNIITQNQIKLNQNLSDSIHCILLLTPQTYNANSVNNCFSINNNLTPPKVGK